MPLFHPRPLRLNRFAAGDLTGADAPRLARHLAVCGRCRRRVTFYRELGDALSRLPQESIDGGLIDRVISQRGSGGRAILPLADGALRVRRSHAVPLAAAALLILSTLTVITVSHHSWRESPDESANAEAALLRSFILPRSAFASSPPPSQNFSPIEPVGSKVRAGHLVYSYRHAARETGRGDIVLTAANMEGRAAWRVIQHWQAADTIQSETLYVDRGSLGILGRTTHVKPYAPYREISVRQRVRADSVLGWMNTDAGLGRPIARQLPAHAAPFVTDGFAPLALWGVPLSKLWRGRFSVLGWAVRADDLYIPVTVQVLDEQRLITPAGTFDCWVLALRTKGGAQRLWVRKADGVGVRLLDETPPASNPREIVLIAENVDH